MLAVSTKKTIIPNNSLVCILLFPMYRPEIGKDVAAVGEPKNGKESRSGAKTMDELKKNNNTKRRKEDEKSREIDRRRMELNEGSRK